jgi:hypothetical protein
MSACYARALVLMAMGVLIGTTAIGGSVSNQASGLVTLTFSSQTGAPMPESATVVAATNPAAGAVAYLTFSFLASDAVPSTLRVGLNCRSGRQWSRTLALPRVGVWQPYVVPVDYTAGWTIGPWKTAALFEADTETIESASLSVGRGADTAAQRYTAVDVALQGAEWGSADADGDGASNAGEVLAGTNPFDAASALALHLWAGEGPGEGFGISWDAAADRFYTVWRGTNLMVPWLPQQSGIPANPPRNYHWDGSATGVGPYFYRVTVDLIGP